MAAGWRCRRWQFVRMGWKCPQSTLGMQGPRVTCGNSGVQCETSSDVSHFGSTRFSSFSQLSLSFRRKRNPSNVPKILNLCNIAGKLLEESLVYNRTTRNEMILVSSIGLRLDLKTISTIFLFQIFSWCSCWCAIGSSNRAQLAGKWSSKRTPWTMTITLCTLRCRVMCWRNSKLIWIRWIASSTRFRWVNEASCQGIEWSLTLNHFQIAKSRVYLYEAICRLMAGASPGHTQELLDRSAHEQVRRNRSTFHCGGSGNAGNNGSITNGNGGNTDASRRCGQNNVSCVDGERERATAMYVACKYLPTPLLCLPGERAGMLAEAAKTLKKVGDRKKLKDCYQLMKTFGNATTTVTAN